MEYEYTHSSDLLKIKLDTICAAAVDLGSLRPVVNHEEKMKNKIRALLYAAYDNGKKDLILGAFGCGMFLNDPVKVAEYFKEITCREFPGVFRNIVFAIKDSRGKTFKAFVDAFPQHYRTRIYSE